jgi:pimeloyl-ACP methyl ester carboxylesterase
MRGFGQADPFDEAPLLPQLDSFVADFVAAHSPKRKQPPPILVGNSLGGVASLRALQNPDLAIAGIAPVSPAGLGHQPWVDMISRDPIIHRIITSRRTPMPMDALRRAVATVYLRLAVCNRKVCDPDAARYYASTYRSREDVVRLVRNARIVLPELSSPYQLERINRPVTMIWGARDRLTPIRGAQRVLDAVPGAKLVRLEGVGHCAQVEVPERVADLVCEFADEIA